jgi:hypothetical protein
VAVPTPPVPDVLTTLVATFVEPGPAVVEVPKPPVPETATLVPGTPVVVEGPVAPAPDVLVEVGLPLMICEEQAQATRSGAARAARAK